MKVEGWLFLGCGVFFAGSDIVYWYVSYDPTGTAALALAVALALLTGFYLLFTGRRLPVRPEDDEQGEIADHLHISPATAKTHVAHLLTKLDARDRVQLVIIAYQAGLTHPVSG